MDGPVARLWVLTGKLHPLVVHFPDDSSRFGLTLALRLAVTLGPHEVIGTCHVATVDNLSELAHRF